MWLKTTSGNYRSSASACQRPCLLRILGGSSACSFLWLQSQFTELWQEHGDILLDDAPQQGIADTEITMDQTVAHGDDHSSGDVWMCLPYRIRNMCCRLADQLQIAHGGVK
jgi:hypothetical protein